VRCLKNKLTRDFEKLERAGTPAEELERLGVGKLREAVVEGNTKTGSVMTGQIAGLINDIKPVDAIIKGIIYEAVDVLKNTGKVLGR
ncbi:MAG: enoyl-[acyl-carrier-protein] reductase FabK, partial [Bacillota bacterium]